MSNGAPPAKRAAMMDEYFDPVDMRSHYHLSQEDDTGPVVDALGGPSYWTSNWQKDVAEALATLTEANNGKPKSSASTPPVQSTFPPHTPAHTNESSQQQPLSAHYTSSAMFSLLSAPPPPPPPEPEPEPHVVAPLAVPSPPSHPPGLHDERLFPASGDTDQRRGQRPNPAFFARLSSPATPRSPCKDQNAAATGVGTADIDAARLRSATTRQPPSPPQWPGRPKAPPKCSGLRGSQQEDFPPLSAVVSRPTPSPHSYAGKTESDSSSTSGSVPPGFTPSEIDYREFRSTPESSSPAPRNGMLVLRRSPQSHPRSLPSRPRGSDQWPSDGHDCYGDAYGGEAGRGNDGAYGRRRSDRFGNRWEMNCEGGEGQGDDEDDEDEDDGFSDYGRRSQQQQRIGYGNNSVSFSGNGSGSRRGGRGAPGGRPQVGRTQFSDSNFSGGKKSRTMGGAGVSGGWKRNNNSSFQYQTPQGNDDDFDDAEALEPLDQQQNKLINPSASCNGGFVTYTLRELKQAEQHVADSHLGATEQGTVFDTHCHIDFLLNKLPNKGKNGGSRGVGGRGSALTGTIFGSTMGETYERYKKTKGGNEYGKLFGGCIACFCHPSSFDNERDFNSLFSITNVYGSFGCHPHWVADFTPEYREAMIKALQHEKVVATGEIGLDYSVRGRGEPDRELQKKVFRDQIQIALHVGKPLVIHCREAHEDCISIMKEMVPKEYMIHRHCVTQGWDEIEEWSDHFLNCYFGFTNYITMDRVSEVHEVIHRLPLSRIILETDAPYHVPVALQNSGRKMSHPGMVVHVAAQIACIKRLNLKAVVRECRKNSKTLYGV